MLLTCLVFCAVLLCVFTFSFPYCDIRYDFPINMMFGSCLPPVVCRSALVLFTVLMFACVLWCPAHYVVLFFLFYSSCVACPFLFPLGILLIIDIQNENKFNIKLYGKEGRCGSTESMTFN